uniref:Uncharacterized protein n=1 Tax=Moniliophthora roreri TaxID=221103 RepID=A0A0W0EWT7_MONRR
MSFNYSSGFSFSGENNFDNVHGHQFNAPIHGNVVFSAEQAMVKRTEYDQFREVIRGDMIPVKELYSEDLSTGWDQKWRNGKPLCRRKSAQRTIYTVELVDRQSKFTAMIYEGEGAHSAWENDFRQFSRTKEALSIARELYI